jgi:hypothetical protein
MVAVDCSRSPVDPCSAVSSLPPPPCLCLCMCLIVFSPLSRDTAVVCFVEAHERNCLTSGSLIAWWQPSPLILTGQILRLFNHRRQVACCLHVLRPSIRLQATAPSR